MTLVQATDLHYLSQRLTDNGPAFERAVLHGDGKIALRIEELAEGFTEDICRMKPEFLIYSGDLSYNGETESHKDLIRKLHRMETAGTKVLVIPGNHDMESPRAKTYQEEKVLPAATPTKEEFFELYRSFGYDQAESRAPDSFSYAFSAGENLVILMLDANSVHFNTLSDETLAWAEEQLKKASKVGRKVLGVTHENLFAHSDLISRNFRLENADALRKLYLKYGVHCNLSGHIHLQHIQTEDGITEAATGALSVGHLSYAVLNWDGSVLTYQKQPVSGHEDLHREAEQIFPSSSYKMARAVLEQDSSLNGEEKDRASSLFAEMNTAYFQGDPMDLSGREQELNILKSAGGQLGPFTSSIARDLNKKIDKVDCRINLNN